MLERPIMTDDDILENRIKQAKEAELAVVNEEPILRDQLTDMLEKSCSLKDVTEIIIFQINELQKDIKDLEYMRENLKNIFPKDTLSYRNTYIIENKVKTFTGFYTTILSYKRELNEMLCKLRAMLNTGGGVEEFKIAIKEVLNEHASFKTNMNDNKEKLKELIKEKPNFMPNKL